MKLKKKQKRLLDFFFTKCVMYQTENSQVQFVCCLDSSGSVSLTLNIKKSNTAQTSPKARADTIHSEKEGQGKEN